MGKKIFVSYKHSDSKVKWVATAPHNTCRAYVNELENLLAEDHIYKGEDDDASMNTLADSTIATKLGDKIFDSTVTIVLVSKGFKVTHLQEKDQWIPWEVSYSLREQSRNGQTSKTNAVLAVVIPDENGSYDYYITQSGCSECNSRTLNRLFLFPILKKNMFNSKNPVTSACHSSTVYHGDSSYIQSIKWTDFIKDHNRYIDKALELKQHINQFDITKNL